MVVQARRRELPPQTNRRSRFSGVGCDVGRTDAHFGDAEGDAGWNNCQFFPLRTRSVRGALGVLLPIINYFIFVGSLLLALLFAADRYLPPRPDAIRASEVDRTIIRIHSARALPEKIIFDTSQPVAAASAVALADERPGDDPREAHAMIAEPSVQRTKTALIAGHAVERQRARPRKTAGDRRFAFDQHQQFPGW